MKGDWIVAASVVAGVIAAAWIFWRLYEIAIFTLEVALQ